MSVNPLEGVVPQEIDELEAEVSASVAVPPDAVKTPPLAPKTQARAPKPGELLEYATPHLKDLVLDVLPVDLNGDGQEELVLLSSRHLFVWRYVEGAFVEVQRLAFPRPFPVRTTVGRLVAGDMGADGEVEILVYVSSLQRGGVFRYRDGGLVKAQNITAMPLAVGQDGKLLSTILKPGFLMSGKDAKWYQPLEKGAAFSSNFLMDDAYAFEEAEGSSLYMLVDGAWKLKVIGSGFKAFLNEKVGFVLSTVRGRSPGHFLIFTSGNGTQEELDGLRAYQFDRQKIEPLWVGKPMGGAVTQVRFSDYDLDGTREAVVLVRNYKAGEFRTRLVFLDLSRVESLEKWGDFSP